MPAKLLAFLASAAMAVSSSSCDDEEPPSLGGRGERWLEADALFHQDPKWLGGDMAATIDLGGDRSLWIFGDSFVATSPANTRSASKLVRNSVAVMTGRDPLTATMQFAWRGQMPTAPSSFFPEEGDRWFWPADGIRLADGRLFLLLNRFRPTPGQGLGFAAEGFTAVQVRDPSGPPATWQLEPVTTSRAPHDAEASIACAARDDAHWIALVVDGSFHRGRLARWPIATLSAEALAAPEWWTGSGWARADALTADPAIVLDSGATECSLHRDPSGVWVHVSSRGFGGTPIAIRTAPALEGPWSASVDVFTPPESMAPDAFVYAGKAHPELSSGAGGGLVVTYADNSFTFADLFDPARADTLYWPHFARLVLE